MPDSCQVKLKVLTPIHIGSGETLNRLDYYFDEGGKFCRVNLDSLFADPDFASQRDDFLAAAPGGQRIDKLVPRELLSRHIRYRLPVSKSALDWGRDRTLELRPCIKTAGRVYIPGSSIKGAILSALCWKTLTEETAQHEIRELLLKGSSDSLLKTVLPRLGGRAADKLGKFTHWLDVSDSNTKQPADCLGLSLVEVKNPQSTLSAKNLRLLAETIQAKSEFTFRLKLDPASHYEPKTLLDAVADFYRQVFEADRLKETDKFDLPANSSVIRLGSGSSSFATSLLLVARKTGLDRGRDAYRVKQPKTRKRVGRADCPLGWAQLELEAK